MRFSLCGTLVAAAGAQSSQLSSTPAVLLRVVGPGQGWCVPGAAVHGVAPSHSLPEWHTRAWSCWQAPKVRARWHPQQGAVLCAWWQAAFGKKCFKVPL